MKLDAGLITSLPASDPGSTAVWGSKRINPQPQSCSCLTWSGYPSNDDDDDDEWTNAKVAVQSTVASRSLLDPANHFRTVVLNLFCVVTPKNILMDIN